MHGPYVNLNGASRESLIEAHMAVIKAARDLRQALANAAPHGRDYQTAPDGYIYPDDRNQWACFTGNVSEIEQTYQGIAERLSMETERGYISPELRRQASLQWEREAAERKARAS